MNALCRGRRIFRGLVGVIKHLNPFLNMRFRKIIPFLALASILKGVQLDQRSFSAINNKYFFTLIQIKENNLTTKSE